MKRMSDSVQPEKLREAMRQWATGVALVTVGDDQHAHGMTVNSFTSISLDPALILVSMKQNTRTHQMARDNERFAVTILHSDQKDLSDIFAGRVADDANRFEGIQTDLTPSGIPVPAMALAVLDCSVERTIEAGTHTVFIALVKHATVSRDHSPLLYFNRDYRQFST